MDIPTPESLLELKTLLQAGFSPDLLRAPYDALWSPENPTLGFCSIASEAAWFLLGGKEAGWVAHSARDVDGSTHWWLEHTSGLIFDPTREQYDAVGHSPPYERGIKGRPGGFMGIRKDPDSEWGCGYRPGLRAQALLKAISPPAPPKRQFRP